MLGLNPIKPGLQEFVLKQPSIIQKHIEATLPVGNGFLKVTWKFKNQKKLYLNIPDETVVKLATKTLLNKGQQLYVNKKIVVDDSDHLSLGKGDYFIEVN